MRCSEDDSRVRDREAAQNVALARRITLGVPKNERTQRTCIRLKRMRAGGDAAYALQVLFSAKQGQPAR